MEYLRKIEEEFDVDEAFVWLKENFTFSIYCSAFYLLSIYMLQVYMRSHNRLVLRTPLAIWSFSLGAYSAIGAYHTLYYFIPKIWNDGLISGCCDETFIRGQTGLWLFLFIISKFPELFDTYFITLRKGPLIFLHWYHHITVFIYCWYFYSQRAVIGIIFSCVNYFVHACMYTYYGLKAKQVTIPRFVNMCITSLQIVQMVFGMYIGLVMYWNQEILSSCGNTPQLTAFTLLMYSSYFVLFMHFFYGTYISVKKKPASPKELESPSKEKVHANGTNGMGKIRVRSYHSRLLRYFNILFLGFN